MKKTKPKHRVAGRLQKHLARARVGAALTFGGVAHALGADLPHAAPLDAPALDKPSASVMHDATVPPPLALAAVAAEDHARPARAKFRRKPIARPSERLMSADSAGAGEAGAPVVAAHGPVPGHAFNAAPPALDDGNAESRLGAYADGSPDAGSDSASDFNSDANSDANPGLGQDGDPALLPALPDTAAPDTAATTAANTAQNIVQADAASAGMTGQAAGPASAAGTAAPTAVADAPTPDRALPATAPVAPDGPDPAPRSQKANGSRVPASEAPAQAAPASGRPPQPPPFDMSNGVDFNADFLSVESGATAVDVSRFARGNPVLPGDYRVDLYLNGQAQSRVDVQVRATSDPLRGRVCMTQALLDQVGLDWSKLSDEQMQAFASADGCAALEAVAPGATAVLDTGDLRLDVTVPQALLRRAPRGYVSPDLWNPGVNAATLGYSFNAYRNSSAGVTSDSAYLGLNAGVNLGGWYFRHNGSKSWQEHSRQRYNVLNTYVSRDLPSLTSRITLGDANTAGDLFDTVAFRGVQLASDDRMLPDSQRGYAPVVRGTADTNARVTIRQNGALLQELSVPPGPFEIDDLYPTGYGGNLDVTVTEADGRKKTFQVPYAAVAQLLRPGAQRYSLTAGVVRSRWLSQAPKMYQATYQRGLTNSLTAYGGLQGSQHYGAVLGGLAFGSKLGAFSVDLAHAQTRTAQDTFKGASLRLGYSKYIEATGSNVSVAAYRFSTRGFMDFNAATQAVEIARQGGSLELLARPRNRLSLTFNQSLGPRRGQLFVSSFAQSYWDSSRRDVQAQIGYSNSFRSLNYGVSLNRVRNSGGRMENQVMLNLTLPLGKTPQAPMLGMNLTRRPDAGVSVQTTLSGNAGEHNELSYGVSVSRDPGVAGMSGSLNGQYRGERTALQAGYSQGTGYRGASVGASGTVVVHPGGATLSPYTGDTLAVVKAPQAAGARVEGYPGVVLDGRGYAVVPYLTPYRLNEVAIDPKGLSSDVELKTTSQQVAPHAGAVVMLNYATVSGRAALIDATQPDGKALPFGADVLDGDGNSIGMVGQGGRVYVRLQADHADLTVRWGDASGQQCRMPITLPALGPAEDGKASALTRLAATCG